MKVVIFSTGFIENVILDLANSLSKNCKVFLMVPKNHLSRGYEKYLSDKLQFKPFYLPRMRNPKSIFLMKQIGQAINNINPDVLHIQANGHIWFIAGLPYIKHIPIVNTIHDPKPHIGDKQSKGSKLSNIFGKIFTTHYIVHGEEIKRKLIDMYNIDNRSISIVPLGAHSYFKKISVHGPTIEEIPNTILFFGRIWKYKGLEYLIKAEPYISRAIPNVQIIIAGRGENIDYYKKLMKNKNKYIIKNYRISDQEIPELFQRASVVVLPYIEATQSAIIPLSYLFKKPVIATKVGGIPEVLQNGNQGYLVPPRDERSLANAIIKVLNNKKLKIQMGNNGYHYRKNELSNKKIAKKTIESYKIAISYRK